jgi:hypothetical protein
MTAAALSTRIRRLERLPMSVARETQLLKEADIFFNVEPREYLAALQRIRGGLESASVALAKASQRLDAKR